jgi:hypothetical protein
MIFTVLKKKLYDIQLLLFGCSEMVVVLYHAVRENDSECLWLYRTVWTCRRLYRVCEGRCLPMR